MYDTEMPDLLVQEVQVIFLQAVLVELTVILVELIIQIQQVVLVEVVLVVLEVILDHHLSIMVAMAVLDCNCQQLIEIQHQL
jgi:hypothetical protein